MKEQRDILIITGSAASNKKTLDLLDAARIKPPWIGHLNPDDAKAITFHEGRVFWCNDESDMFDGKITTIVYAACVLTPELVATFPNAKPLKPTGPWKFEGRMWEIDGDEKTVAGPNKYVMYAYECGLFHIVKTAPNYQPGEHQLSWPLRPLITAELQAATEAVEETRGELNRLRTAHNNSKTDLMIANRDHKRNLDEVKLFSGNNNPSPPHKEQTMKELKPCPFCGQTEPVALYHSKDLAGCDECRDHQSTQFSVCCSVNNGGCGGAGGYGDTEEEDIALWNNRPQQITAE